MAETASMRKPYKNYCFFNDLGFLGPPRRLQDGPLRPLGVVLDPLRPVLTPLEDAIGCLLDFWHVFGPKGGPAEIGGPPLGPPQCTKVTLSPELELCFLNSHAGSADLTVVCGGCLCVAV